MEDLEEKLTRNCVSFKVKPEKPLEASSAVKKKFIAEAHISLPFSCSPGGGEIKMGKSTFKGQNSQPSFSDDSCSLAMPCCNALGYWWAVRLFIDKGREEGVIPTTVGRYHKSFHHRHEKWTDTMFSPPLKNNKIRSYIRFYFAAKISI
ncbi:hypothetical protein AVEN_8623-1 [Araneus ventricosus]|uniref:Uncharacterized protein n=1 Tax=Araneus ventricosus TaxID=182803 RepID=A0A4Y2C2N8_ARAVE|nr:hypothetical protein AVEN_8623-1 [Araneus ventricosus]